MKLKELAATVVCAATVFGFAGTASAGEWSPGNGDTPIQTDRVANSICAFSGRDQPDTGANPENHFGGEGDDADWAETPARGRVQSPGQIVAALGPDAAGAPGQACRGGGPR